MEVVESYDDFVVAMLYIVDELHGFVSWLMQEGRARLEICKVAVRCDETKGREAWQYFATCKMNLRKKKEIIRNDEA